MIVLMASTALWAAEAAKKFLKPTENNVGIYKNKTHDASEQPLYRVGTEDRPFLVDQQGNMYRVSNVDGVEGWVEKKFMVLLGLPQKKLSFENADVIGYLDNPTPVYIIDIDDPNAERISLDRSFKDALKDNVDKPTLEQISR